MTHIRLSRTGKVVHIAATLLANYVPRPSYWLTLITFSSPASFYDSFLIDIVYTHSEYYIRIYYYVLFRWQSMLLFSI